jgi:hypothetical protein
MLERNEVTDAEIKTTMCSKSKWRSSSLGIAPASNIRLNPFFLFLRLREAKLPSNG